MAIKDVGEHDFTAEVVERSRELPVVVDFWAEWCGPCRQLGPALEQAIGERAGKVELAKVDVDSNQALAGSFGVRGIPAVKAFRDGQVVAEFTGAIPPAQIKQFLDGLVPSRIDELAATGDEESLREALAIEPRHGEASTRLARLLIARGESDDAVALLDELRGDFVAEGLLARARLMQGPGNGAGAADAALATAFAAWDEGDHETALDALQERIAAATDPDRRDLIRQVMVGIFTELGADHELARERRRRLASALS